MSLELVQSSDTKGGPKQEIAPILAPKRYLSGAFFNPNPSEIFVVSERFLHGRDAKGEIQFAFTRFEHRACSVTPVATVSFFCEHKRSPTSLSH